MCRPVCLPTWFTRLVNYIRASTTQKARRQHNSNDSDAHDERERECSMQPPSDHRLPSLRRGECSIAFSAFARCAFVPRPVLPRIRLVSQSPSLPSRCTRFYALSLTPPPKGKRERRRRGGGGGAKWEGHYPSRQFECILYCPFYAGAVPPSLSLPLART